MGTEEFWIPAVVAALGTGVQTVNQNNAQKRQQTAEVQAIDNQQQLRTQANSQVKDLTNQIGRNSPQQIAAKETGDFVKTLRQNQGNKPDSSALTPATIGSARYMTDKGTAQTGAEQYGGTQAGALGAMDAAVRQRQNEALAQQTLGTNLNLIGAQSQSKNFVDQLRAQAVGQANPWASMFGDMLKKGAGAYAQNPDMFKSDSYYNLGV